MDAAKPSRFAETRTVRILLVDDHPLVRQGLAEVLHRQPEFRVCGEAEDHAAALAAIETRKPDLVILDLTLKKSDGLELIKDIRARFPGLRILVVSMHDEMVNAERAIRAGACGYITKQEATTKILSAIRRILAGGIYLSEPVAALVASKLAGRYRAGPVDHLTDRELQVLELIGDGLSTREIAERLHLDNSTVETYRARLKEKLALKDAHDLLQYAIRWMRVERVAGRDIPPALGNAPAIAEQIGLRSRRQSSIPGGS